MKSYRIILRSDIFYSLIVLHSVVRQFFFFSKIIHRRIPAFCQFFLRFPRILFLLAR